MVLKWGIAGAGKISTQFVKAVSILPDEEHQVVAVAAQNLERAQQFAKDFNIERAYGSYKDLSEDKNIDIVYVGNLNTQHLQVSKLMLEHGKHVLCEKPLTLNEKQTTELIKLAEEKQLFLMEAIWSRCFPAYEELKKIVNSGAIGEILHVKVSFGRKFPHIERLASKELGGGTLLDLGIYTLQFAQFIFGGAEPDHVHATGSLNENGVDECVCAILSYPNGKLACISTEARVELSNEGVIYGTKGMITVPRFWCPTTLITPNGTMDFELPDTKNVQFKNFYSVGMAYEVQEVGRCVKAGFLESPKITHKETLQLARLMDKVRQEIGVVFTEDI
ncbi:hypothetical protein ILUMI_06228 [Ignelater luminosus]|uniref:Trans-1,2-dihydrobenzene-1,2-diol dehydrogenase n=1 Tax=Ignelater luminosus TaxID=2038154 RepID=A0A8K0DAQ6_IGNLU|nr:hypothetical protein ILUMI_06228 [Ignelater luminosus]